jgi:hypothetical protein
MNRLKLETYGDVRTAEQLPTPSSTPEPDDLALPNHPHSIDTKDDAPPQDASNLRSLALSGTSTSRRMSMYDDAVLSYRTP